MPARLATLVAVGGALHCGEPAARDEPAAGGVALENPRRVAELTGFSGPQAVLHDTAQDIYFVSNLAGAAGAHDNNGFISRVRPDGSVDSLRWVQGGRDTTVLHAPHGLAIIGQTLWVADLDVLRAFDRRSGAPVGGISLAAHGAEGLSDVAVGGDGALYASDPSAGRVYRITPALEISVVVDADTADAPHALLWDEAGQRLLIAGSRGGSPGGSIDAWSPGADAPERVADGAAEFTGLARFGQGPVLAASRAGNAIFVLRDERLEPLLTRLAGPADLDVDPRRQRLLVPLPGGDRLQVWEFGSAAGRGRAAGSNGG